MRWTLPFLFAVQAAAIAWIALTADHLPARVACHFVTNGVADGWEDRQRYCTVIIAAIAGAPLLLAGVGVLCHLLPPRLLNLPNRDHWMAPERARASRATLAGAVTALGIPVALIVAGIHATVMDANTRQPPMLDTHAAFAVIIVGVALEMALTGWLLWRFRRP
jgi:uncharacterized membrane protein